MPKSILNHSQNTFQIHSVLQEKYDFDHLHNTYPPLGAKGGKENVSHERLGWQTYAFLQGHPAQRLFNFT